MNGGNTSGVCVINLYMYNYILYIIYIIIHLINYSKKFMHSLLQILGQVYIAVSECVCAGR